MTYVGKILWVDLNYEPGRPFIIFEVHISRGEVKGDLRYTKNIVCIQITLKLSYFYIFI